MEAPGNRWPGQPEVISVDCLEKMQWEEEVSEGKDPERTLQAAVTAWGEWGPWVWKEVKGASLWGARMVQ